MDLNPVSFCGSVLLLGIDAFLVSYSLQGIWVTVLCSLEGGFPLFLLLARCGGRYFHPVERSEARRVPLFDFGARSWLGNKEPIISIASHLFSTHRRIGLNLSPPLSCNRHVNWLTSHDANPPAPPLSCPLELRLRGKS